MAIRTTASAGRTSLAANWTGGIKPVSGDVVVINHAMQLDESLGTDGAGIRNLVLNADAANLSLYPGYTDPLTIKFASTGSSPISSASGTANNPFGTDLGDTSTMYGLWIAKGGIDLQGAGRDQITIQGASGPTFVSYDFAHVFWNGSAWAAANKSTLPITLKNIKFPSLGCATSKFQGISVYGHNTTNRGVLESLTVESAYRLFQAMGTGAFLTIKDITLSGVVSDTILFGAYGWSDVLIEGCTETSPISQTASALHFINQTNGKGNYVVKDISVTGLSNMKKGGVSYTSTLANTGVVFDGVKTTNTDRPDLGNVGYRKTYGVYLSAPTVGAVIKNCAGVYDYRGVFLSGALQEGTQVFDNFFLQGRECDDSILNPQGSIFVNTINGADIYSNTLLIQPNTGDDMIGVFSYNSAANVRVRNNTIAVIPGYAGYQSNFCQGVYMGENGYKVTNGICKDNLIYGFKGAGVTNGDVACTYDLTQEPELSLGAGCHHNLICTPYGQTQTPWVDADSSAHDGGFTTAAGLAHPNAYYGDLTTDPLFRNYGGLTRDDYMLLPASPAIGAASDGGNMGALGVYSGGGTPGRVRRITPSAISPSKVAPQVMTPVS